MIERVQTDTDAEGQTQIGVGRSDQLNRAIHQIQANWQEDGHGIRGPQRSVIQTQARPFPMPFGINDARVNPASSQCTPNAPPTTGTHLWGTVDGVCQWIDTTTCS